MIMHDQTGVARESICRDESNENLAISELRSSHQRTKGKDEEYIKDVIEGRKRRKARNNEIMHNALVEGSKWSIKHHGMHIDLSNGES